MQEANRKYINPCNVLFFVIILSSALVIGCGREEDANSENSQIRIVVREATAKEEAHRLLHQKTWWNPPDERKLEESRHVQIMSSQSSPWAAGDPSALSGFDCFAVAVTVPNEDISDTCTDSNGSVVITPSQIVGTVTTGEPLTLTVSSGSGRIFHVIGFNSTTGACPSDISVLDFSAKKRMSRPHILGSATVDLQGGDETVTIAASLTGVQKFERCSGTMDWEETVCQGTLLSASPYASGSGTTDDPYLICTTTQMDAVATTGIPAADWAADFKLMTDLGAFTLSNPIGDGANNYSGTFDGNHYSITGMTITPDGGSDDGFIGRANGATIKNLSLLSTSLTASGNGNGLIAGDITSTTIQDVTATGSLTTGGNSTMGCLVGNMTSSSTLQSADSTCTITHSGTGTDVGGLVGIVNGSTISSSQYSGTLTGTPSGSNAGGIVGQAISSTLTSVTFSGSISLGAAPDNIGGIAGVTQSSNISSATMSGTVAGDLDVGGIVGHVSSGSNTISNCTVSGNTTAGGNQAGGIVGSSGAASGITLNFSDCEVSGNVTGTQSTGGVVGLLAGTGASSTTITDIEVSGTVTGTNDTGGFVGQNNSTHSVAITTSEFTGSIPATGTRVGGLVGTLLHNSSTITSSGFNGTTITGLSDVGGVVGRIGGDAPTLSKVYAVGTSVSSTSGSNVGGIIGNAQSTFTINKTFSNITVSSNTNNAGGIIGFDFAGSNICQDCYARGNVTVTGDSAGGIIGFSSASGSGCLRCYYAGSLIQAGTSETGGIMGDAGTSCSVVDSFVSVTNMNSNTGANLQNGFIVGVDSSCTLTNNVLDSASTCTNSGGGDSGTCVDNSSSSATTVQLQNAANAPLSNWDFSTVWTEVSGDFPQLIDVPNQ